MGNGSFVEGNNCYLSGTPTGFARMIVKHKTEEKMMPLALFQAQVYKTEYTKKSFFFLLSFFDDYNIYASHPHRNIV